ncbi:MAG: hypothetical protein A2Z34_03205 [Planctomycetes bacterium RBG_16_59_8]|nr:MAG: hypothetical protein A2Z34_03205 [Planctomycetes bacterium RBG_16_59_8]
MRNARRDFDGQVIDRVQQIRSHESPVMQLTDVFLGAITYHHRKMQTNPSKLDVIRRIQRLSGKDLETTTWLRESKLNLLCWQGQGGQNVWP